MLFRVPDDKKIILFKDNRNKNDMGDCKLMQRVSSEIKDNI